MLSKVIAEFIPRKQVENGAGGEAEGICSGEDMQTDGEIVVLEYGNRPSGEDDPGGFPISGKMLSLGNILDWESENDSTRRVIEHSTYCLITFLQSIANSWA